MSNILAGRCPHGAGSGPKFHVDPGSAVVAAGLLGFAGNKSSGLEEGTEDDMLMPPAAPAPSTGPP